MGKRRPVRLGQSATGRPGLVDPVRRDPAGLRGPTPKQARGRYWRATSHGLFVPADVDGSVPEQRIVEAAAVLPSYGGVTGWAALRWMGARWFGGLAPDGLTELPIWLATAGDDIRPQPGFQVSAERLNPIELMVVDGIRVTVPVRSVTFEMRYAASVRSAVVAADMAMQADLVSPSELVDFVAGLSGWTGVPRCRAALPLTSENSWSPRETSHLRLVWVLDAGLPPPLCNVPIFDRSGRHIGTPDILDEEAGVAGEYDGALHLEGSQRARDVRREEAFRSVGLEYFTVLASDARDPFDVVRRMRATRARARFAAPSDRAWTVDKPPWWIATETVDQRRALSDAQRERLLRHRAG
ncbi:hypothetical protein [Nocardioides cynanchi]|uniref:hypothetical protein n=1 Tax=Nocardioides cynanchi TaxID=2558918 RepID=UPI001248DE0A|nr:hypothetical protein [Nocardioides cynanchi]